jgi:hypothetical protein
VIATRWFWCDLLPTFCARCRWSGWKHAHGIIWKAYITMSRLLYQKLWNRKRHLWRLQTGENSNACIISLYYLLTSGTPVFLHKKGSRLVLGSFSSQRARVVGQWVPNTRQWMISARSASLDQVSASHAPRWATHAMARRCATKFIDGRSGVRAPVFDYRQVLSKYCAWRESKLTDCCSLAELSAVTDWDDVNCQVKLQLTSYNQRRSLGAS